VFSSAILQQLLTARAGWTVAIALALLVAIGVVKPVRATGSFAQRVWENFPGLRPLLRPRVEPPAQVEHLPVVLYRRPRLLRRLLAGVGGLALSLVTGALLAIVLGAGAIWLITNLTGRLR
jgi:hypothetical protein